MAGRTFRSRKTKSHRVIAGAALAIVLTTSCGMPTANPGSTASSTRLGSPSVPPLQRPEPRQGGFLFVDPGSGHLLLVGGIDPTGTDVTSTWSWDGQVWNQLNATSDGIQAAFFDSVRKEVIALQVAGGAANTTVSWSGTWASRNTTHVPSPMVDGSGYSMFNPSTKSALYCGIRNQTTDAPGLETWTWDGTDWSLQTGPSPAKRIDYALGYDPVSKTDLLFGGGPGGGPNPLFEDTWSWNGTGWALLHPSHSPAPGGAYATFDESLNALVLLDFTGSMWRWTGSDWSAVTSSGSGPGAHRNGAVFGYDPISRQVLVFGGSVASIPATANTWLWDGASWVTAA